MSEAGSLTLRFGLPAMRAAAVVTLLKPITWFAPIWAFGCGVVAGGGPGGRIGVALAGLVLAGPLVCGTSQAVNDWFDRHVDALNEPGRPIPSGRLPGRSGLAIAVAGSVLSVLVAALLGPVVLAAALVGLGLGWAYSAPPLRLKRDGWWGNAACGACYEGLPWVTGAALMHHDAAGAAGWGVPGWGVPGWPSLAIAALYSLGAHGIMTLNDFKSETGDAAMGVRSLPVQLGTHRAAWVACAVMALAQALVAALLAGLGHWIGAGAILGLLAAQAVLMRRLIGDPRRLAPWYNGTGTTLYVLGMLAAAFSVRAG